jgi:hypothetical protein
MEINKVKQNKIAQLSDLDAGSVFRYPRGTTLYQVCEPVGNLAGVYTIGRKSKKTKVWAVNLANGNISAVDFDSQVLTCSASINYHEN